MKVLVVDDDTNARKVMHLFLGKSGYDPILHETGQAGLSAALAPEAPVIMVLDWMLPDMDGLALCRQIRSARPKCRPYIFILSSRQSKDDIAAGLDAGADDFITKPFNVVEFQARLRVARRTIDYQRELIQQTSENTHLSQRNKLLGELIGRRQEPVAATPPPPPPPPPRPPPVSTPEATAATPAGGSHGLIDFKAHEIRHFLTPAFHELRLALQQIRTVRREGSPWLGLDYVGWDALFLPGHDRWIDITLGAKGAALGRIFAGKLGRPAAGELDLSSFLAELARITAHAFAQAYAWRGDTPQQPLVSRACLLPAATAAAGSAEDRCHHDLQLEGEELRLALHVYPCPLLHLAPAEARPLDILADSFPPRAECEVPLFNDGTVLTPRFIEKLGFFQDTAHTCSPITLRRPSPLARTFHRPA